MPDLPAVVLLSGGLDSATVLAVALDEGFVPHCLSFNYGQRHSVELACARRVAASMGAAGHVVVEVDPAVLRGSALTDDIDVPHPADGTVGTEQIPVTYVPARNTIFLSYGLGLAESIGAWDIFIGVNALDYSGYPDCRPAFVDAFERMANLATKAAVEGRGRFRVRAPLISMTKADTIRLGVSLGVDYGLTHSCYDPGAGGEPCSTCESCLLRARGFAEAGMADPALAR